MFTHDNAFKCSRGAAYPETSLILVQKASRKLSTVLFDSLIAQGHKVNPKLLYKAMYNIFKI